MTGAVAATAGLALSLLPAYTPWRMALLLTAMGLGLAFTDVVVDALMVEHGQRWQLTGAFQAVQWASIETASVLVGVGGGRSPSAAGCGWPSGSRRCFRSSR